MMRGGPEAAWAGESPPDHIQSEGLVEERFLARTCEGEGDPLFDAHPVEADSNDLFSFDGGWVFPWSDEDLTLNRGGSR